MADRFDPFANRYFESALQDKDGDADLDCDDDEYP